MASAPDNLVQQPFLKSNLSNIPMLRQEATTSELELKCLVQIPMSVREVTSECFPSEQQNPAVSVQNGFKQYGNQIVLNNFNMTVRNNTIYGLLGASGCGKTTILSCIIALRTLDSGTISICGYPTGTKESGIPGKRIGYMPQEIALNGEFKINEVLEYFGRIYGMTKTRVQERFSYLVKLLSLEKCKENLIRNMSDGQKRRVSLAVTLLHEPEILILDEPTVGCDALLRQTIWNFLTELVMEKNVTVIVTTHYIEETKQANTVGIMRNGRLLVENSPNALLQKFNATLLDDIVLKLCEKDEAEGQEDNQDDDDNEILTFKKTELDFFTKDHSKRYNNRIGQNELALPSVGTATTTWTNRLFALVVKNLVVLRRNLSFTLFLLTIPSTLFMLLNFCIASEPSNLKFGIISDEFPACNHNATQSSLVSRNACISVNLSCLYLNALDKEKIQLVSFETSGLAIKEIQHQRLWGFIQFEKNFSTSIFSRLLLRKRDHDVIEGSQIRIRMDTTHIELALRMKKEFQEAFTTFSRNLMTACEMDSGITELPVEFEEPIFGKNDPSEIEFVAPGMSIGLTLFFCGLTCSLTYILEKKDGMINRTLVTGVKSLEIMLSHFIVQLVIAAVQVFINFLLIIFVFNLQCLGSIFLAFIGVLFSCATGMSLGFLTATFCNDEKNTLIVGMGAIFPSFILAGLIWPLENAPKIIQYIGLTLPATQMAEAVRSIFLRGFNLSHHVVWIGFLTSFGWFSLYWIIIIVYHLRFKKNL